MALIWVVEVSKRKGTTQRADAVVVGLLVPIVRVGDLDHHRIRDYQEGKVAQGGLHTWLRICRCDLNVTGARSSRATRASSCRMNTSKTSPQFLARTCGEARQTEKEIISADAPVSSRASESVTERLYPDDDTILEANTLHEPIRPEVIRPDLDGN
jgi:hypothetical protein